MRLPVYSFSFLFLLPSLAIATPDITSTNATTCKEDLHYVAFTLQRYLLDPKEVGDPGKVKAGCRAGDELGDAIDRVINLKGEKCIESPDNKTFGAISMVVTSDLSKFFLLCPIDSPFVSGRRS
ncbi:uncharacterized protein K489DRAFT_378800 [Dissoconium aciculare CBS 342.82]|uniref:Uncharacterized protein n=1 Tax=Dissoconium aciculare CBS 342.82 TaxID=1314786 RepID=A0A6J3M8R1_9PEZI|nr:uncharacterized protein K489DRAFT_378800 [Dissoconium aciculare CBS 342.82]KAF1824385.1 hypothetical protein K489DRAFT_378800 [Dissoconium aciculare CBS 342.82]